jgi:hypothetical protein
VSAAVSVEGRTIFQHASGTFGKKKEVIGDPIFRIFSMTSVLFFFFSTELQKARCKPRLDATL